jgi:hypothetical protein
MKKKMERGRRGWFLWIGGACFLVGSLVAGSVGLASSAGPPISGPVTANQGAPGISPWPVSGNVGVNNFPQTQQVSGTVGIDQTTTGANGVTVKNFPSNQTVNGTVGIDPNNNTVKLDPSSQATVTSGDQTTRKFTSSVTVPAGSTNLSTPEIDTSSFKTIRVSINCLNLSASLTWTIIGDISEPMASGNCSPSTSFTESFDVPGLFISVSVSNTSAFPLSILMAVDGRSN